MAAGRLYTVEKGEEMTIVRAMSPAQAIKHVTQHSYVVRPSTAEDAITYVTAGGEVEVTKEVLDLEGKGPDGQPLPEATEGDDGQ